jgi:diphthamide biosynthesis protein 7
MTGADDCKLKGWDTRAPSRPAFINSRSHTMGVTSIQTDPRSEHHVLTGSYDERLRIVDLRMPTTELCALPLGGGVWCARWHPRDPGAILTACMHNGFHIARAGGDQLEHVASYEGHGVGDALAYGADWSHAPAHDTSTGPARLLGATCSFYDHALHLWAVPTSLLTSNRSDNL